MSSLRKLTKAVTPKFTEEDFERLRSLAHRDGKCLGEWCRDRLLEVVDGVPPTTSDHALLAEIVAVEDIVVDLLCAFGHDGKLTSQKAQEIVDAAHERKYRDVPALFKYAHSRNELKRPNR
jgi:hypothetical protein